LKQFHCTIPLLCTEHQSQSRNWNAAQWQWFE